MGEGRGGKRRAEERSETKKGEQQQAWQAWTGPKGKRERACRTGERAPAPAPAMEQAKLARGAKERKGYRGGTCISLTQPHVSRQNEWEPCPCQSAERGTSHVPASPVCCNFFPSHFPRKRLDSPTVGGAGGAPTPQFALVRALVWDLDGSWLPPEDRRTVLILRNRVAF